MVMGVAGPDTLGASHGHYLPQRIVLLAIAAAVPVLRFGKLATGLIVVAWALQSAVVWDYARASEETAGRFIRAGKILGDGDRVAALLTEIETPFRANPLLHADCALGVGTNRVIWGDYETRFYYFPVRFREGVEHPDAGRAGMDRLESRFAGKGDAVGEALGKVSRGDRCAGGLGENQELDEVNARWYEEVRRDGRARVWRVKP